MTNQTTDSRYYTSSSYLLPSDDEERKRLGIQHRMLTKAFDDRLILAPVKWKEGDAVLEVGAAGGAWMNEATQAIPAHTNVKFYGIDIESRLFPPQPLHNTSYSVTSVLTLPEIWTGRFAYIHQRLLMAALTDSQWPTALQQLYRVTKPGGWVELIEGAVTFGHPKNHNRHRAFDLLSALYAARSINSSIGQDLADLLANAGFIDITTVYKTIPLGKWGGELGELCSQSIGDFFRGIKKPVLLYGGFGVVKTDEEYEALVDNLIEEWDNVPGYYWDVCNAYARKPGGAHE